MTRIASHRGGTLEFGDSTPRGFHATAALPVDELEFDLHPTRDGAIMVHHDARLDRTTDGTGAIAEQTEAEVRAAVIHYSEGGHPISLSELCAIFKRSKVDFRCEIKAGADGMPYRGFVPKVVAMLQQEGMLQRTVFSSFQVETVDELGLASDRPRLWLVSPDVLSQLGAAAVIELARAHRIPEIGVQVDLASAGLQAQARAAGLDFGVWGAHRTAQIDKALALGVKVFTTDRPSLAIERRREHLGASA